MRAMETSAYPSPRLVSFVQACQTRAPLVHQKFRPIFPKTSAPVPIPFFGPIEEARVLTVGLNPSTTEFDPKRCWPRELPSVTLTGRLYRYFELAYPSPHPWFDELEMAFRVIDCSYRRNVAHIDVSPWPTFGPHHLRKRGYNHLESYKSLLQNEVKALSNLVGFCRELKLVILLIADAERDSAIREIKKAFGGRIKTQRKERFYRLVSENKRELAELVEPVPIEA